MKPSKAIGALSNLALLLAVIGCCLLWFGASLFGISATVVGVAQSDSLLTILGLLVILAVFLVGSLTWRALE